MKGFVYLPSSRMWLRVADVNATVWVGHSHDGGPERTPRWTKTWSLSIFVNGSSIGSVFGDDPAVLLEALGLPKEPPKDG